MKHRTLVVAATALLMLTSCVESSGPDDELCAEPSVSIDVSLTVEAMDPATISVCRDQDVTLVVHSDVEGVIHIHGYDDQVPATELDAEGETRLSFTAARSGQFPLELHPQDDPSGIDVGVLTVHEP
jgi:hypothetical protein